MRETQCMRRSCLLWVQTHSRSSASLELLGPYAHPKRDHAPHSHTDPDPFPLLEVWTLVRRESRAVAPLRKWQNPCAILNNRLRKLATSAMIVAPTRLAIATMVTQSLPLTPHDRRCNDGGVIATGACLSGPSCPGLLGIKASS